MHRHEGSARLNQSPRQERALAPVVPAILVAQARVLAANVKGLARDWTRDEVECLLIEPVHGLGGAVTLQRAAGAVEMPRQRAAILDALQGKTLGEVQVLHVEGGGAGIAA